MSNKLYFKEEPRRKGDFDKPPEFGAPKTSHQHEFGYEEVEVPG